MSKQCLQTKNKDPSLKESMIVLQKLLQLDYSPPRFLNRPKSLAWLGLIRSYILCPSGCCKRIRMELEIGSSWALRAQDETDLSSMRILCQQPFSKNQSSCALVLLCSDIAKQYDKYLRWYNSICARIKLSKELLCSDIAKMISMYHDIILSLLG